MKFESKTAALSVVGAVALSASPAPAAETPEFAALDRDGDGYLSREEARGSPPIMERFTRVDADKDRRLSPAEFAEARRLAQG